MKLTDDCLNLPRRAGSVLQGLKPQVLRARYGTTKVVPFQNGAAPMGLEIDATFNPTLKRGANNRCAYGASGTTKVVPFQNGAAPMGLEIDATFNPTLKRGANNRCAYGASGTTKVVPFQNGAAPTGLEIDATFNPTLKRGANNHCAYGASGTTKVVPFQNGAVPTGLEVDATFNPTLKRGANNRCAYGASGTTKAMPFRGIIYLVRSILAYLTSWILAGAVLALLAAAAAAPAAWGEARSFSLSTSRTFAPGESVKIQLFARNVPELEFRVYKVRDAEKFFAGLKDLHSFGVKSHSPSSRSTSETLLERLARLQGASVVADAASFSAANLPTRRGTTSASSRASWENAARWWGRRSLRRFRC